LHHLADHDAAGRAHERGELGKFGLERGTPVAEVDGNEQRSLRRVGDGTDQRSPRSRGGGQTRTIRNGTSAP